MATGVDISVKTSENLDGLLTCNICLEILKEPKLLPCVHTFCKLCIHTYIDSVKEKKVEKIPCPVCRKPDLSFGSSDDVEAIVKALPENHFAISLLDQLLIAKSEKLCDPCNFNGTESKAAVWCGICDEAYCNRCKIDHKKYKLFAKHDLISIEDVGKTGSEFKTQTPVFCSDHNDRVVEVYCVDHKKACCTLCATLSHRKCDRVTSIEEAASGIKNRTEVSDLRERMDEIHQILTDVINSREKNEANMETETKNIESVVLKMIKEMKEHLDKMQNKILSELDAVKKKTSMKVADDINDLTSYRSAVTNWKNMLDGIVTHGSEQQCLIIHNELAPKVDELKIEIKTALEKIQYVSVRFGESKSYEEFLKTFKSVGDLKIDESKINVKRGKFKLFHA